MNKIKLIVYNEYALGYIKPETPNKLNVLADNITKGAPFKVLCGPYFIGKKDKVRLASRKDFDDFRVSFEGYDNFEHYEYNISHNNIATDMGNSNKSCLVCLNCKSTDIELLDNEGVAICKKCLMEWPYINK